ncbi:MAG: methyltransferase domain-containing protein [Candidatus Aenigmarchaeota archaeon]|nr:methyltransferase domain-containing protein [Candidatus Aenigmarchaeota archaeon]
MMHQFFLENPLILEKEADLADVKEGDVVLEIGAGTGNLTRTLAERASVIAVEKDGQFIKKLKKIGNTKVVHGDALDFLKERHDFNKVVSNIPYYISQPILLALLKHRWDACVLLVQKEFAEKCVSSEKLGLIVRECCDAKICGFVSEDEFAPKGIDSALLALRQRKLLDEKFWSFLCRAFVVRNRNASKLEGCPARLAAKKIHQLTLEELKEIYGAIKVKNLAFKSSADK